MLTVQQKVDIRKCMASFFCGILQGNIRNKTTCHQYFIIDVVVLISFLLLGNYVLNYLGSRPKLLPFVRQALIQVHKYIQSLEVAGFT